MALSHIRLPSAFRFLCRRNPRKTLHCRFLAMSWTCSKCTFINPSSQTFACLICCSSSSIPQCPSSSSAPSPSSAPRWSCKACTFLNPYRNPLCEVCGTRALVSSLSSFEDLNCTDLDGELDASVGSVFLPLQLCNKRKNRDPVDTAGAVGGLGGFRGIKSANKAVAVLGELARFLFFLFGLFSGL